MIDFRYPRTRNNGVTPKLYMALKATENAS